MSRYTAIDVRDVPRWDSEADVVVVGLGASGVCAAIEARSLGADVLVLERASGGGGITMNAAGHLYLGGGTRVQKAVGVEDSVEDMEKYLLAVTPAPDEEKIHLYCEQSVAHFDWLVAQGVPFNDTMYKGKHVLQMTDECLIWSGNEEVWPYRDQAKPAPRGHKVAQVGEAGGAKMMEKLIARANELGVRTEIDAHVHTLVREGPRIVGVLYDVFGTRRAARARRGVILATGHFTNNEEMLRQYCPKLADPRMTRQMTPNDDGSGIQLGLAVGGVADHMDGALVTCPFYPPESLIKGILVNQLGKRFVAEDSYHSRTSIIASEQPDGVAYLLVDDECFGRPEFGGYEPVDAWESVAAMERGLRMPEGALQATVKRFNENAAKGQDPEFHKGKKWLKPLDHPPFAALQGSVGEGAWMCFTLGGLRVTKDGEVVRADGAKLPGLYAVGACASNIAQDGTGYSSGTCIGESTFFGRRAGRHAARA
ncbi:MAG TPA: FAD-dependent oxidoreductase [Myxococcota bacterium]|nr:FAD-dependent oxidoreductase [Myxococcota bacterium]